MLSNNLKKLRERKGITQAELADRLGITQQAVARWERGKSNPDTDTLKQLANYFGVSTDYLLDNESSPDVLAYYLEDDEPRLLDGYRALNADGQNALLFVLQSLRLSHPKQAKGAVVQKTKNGNNFLVNGGNNAFNANISHAI